MSGYSVRLGLLSDTHGLLRPSVLTHFDGVELILHAGDVGDPDILVALGAVAPVHAVYGNTDGFALRNQLRARVELELEGTQVLVTHGDELGAPTAARLRAAYPHAQVIVYGHTHVQRTDTVEGALIVNPGAAGPARFRREPSVALLELHRGAPASPTQLRVIPLGAPG